MLMKCSFEIIFLIAYYDRVIYADVLLNVAQVVYCITSFQTDNFSLRRQFQELIQKGLLQVIYSLFFRAIRSVSL
jgi:hypothetical protein